MIAEQVSPEIFPGLNRTYQTKFVIETGTAVNRAERIIQLVSECFGISVNDLKSPSRVREIIYPRHIAIHLIKANVTISLAGIGRMFKRDHSTVINSLETYDDIQKDRIFKSYIDTFDEFIVGKVL